VGATEIRLDAAIARAKHDPKEDKTAKSRPKGSNYQRRSLGPKPAVRGAASNAPVEKIGFSAAETTEELTPSLAADAEHKSITGGGTSILKRRQPARTDLRILVAGSPTIACAAVGGVRMNTPVAQSSISHMNAPLFQTDTAQKCPAAAIKTCEVPESLPRHLVEAEHDKTLSSIPAASASNAVHESCSETSKVLFPDTAAPPFEMSNVFPWPPVELPAEQQLARLVAQSLTLAPQTATLVARYIKATAQQNSETRADFRANFSVLSAESELKMKCSTSHVGQALDSITQEMRLLAERRAEIVEETIHQQVKALQAKLSLQ
jgi:hypothetical protein